MSYTPSQKRFIKESQKGKSVSDMRCQKKRCKFVRCVADVEEKQSGKRKKVNPFAVCRTSIGYKGKTRGIGIREEFKGRKIPYRFHKKSSPPVESGTSWTRYRRQQIYRQQQKRKRKSELSESDKRAIIQRYKKEKDSALSEAWSESGESGERPKASYTRAELAGVVAKEQEEYKLFKRQEEESD
jgi:hypothetical protein